MVLEEDIASSKVPAGEFNSSDLEVGGVVVYRDRAEVKRLIRVSVKKGENDVVVNQLPSVVDPKSLRLVVLNTRKNKYKVKRVLKFLNSQMPH